MKRIRIVCVLLLAKAWAEEPKLAELPGIAPTKPFVFAVLGDNRGDDTGQQPSTFYEVLKAVQKQSPAFILDSGDMIYGHSSDENRVREQWQIYRKAIEPLRIPIFHVPGNHDIWDESSARLYRELWGTTYYSFDYGNARFIGLDTETANGRLGEKQFDWLKQQFGNSKQGNVFVFLHRPLFPIDGAIGGSLDEYPVERDQLHKLFAQNRQVIRGVFAGHEHLYSFQRRDGVPYYISGGAGAPLYVAPELGGFHHFLLVRVSGDDVRVELKKITAPQRKLEKPRRIAPGQVLENWEAGLFWYAWDHTTTVELTRDRASEGRQGLRLNFDLQQYAWPVLVLPLASTLELNQYESLSLDVYVPRKVDKPFLLTPALQAVSKIQTPAVKLKPGWNTIRTDLNGQWFASPGRGKINGLEWSLSTEGTGSRGYLVFDNLRASRRDIHGAGTTASLESFERPLLWRVFDETVKAEIIKTNSAPEKRGLRVHFDFAKCNRPVIFARLNPPWDASKVDTLLLGMESAGPLPDDLTIALAFRKNDVEYRAPAVPLPGEAGQVRFALSENWLPRTVRQGVEQIEFVLVSTNAAGAGEITLEKLSAAGHS